LNNCTHFESNTEVTIRFEISNICTALNTKYAQVYVQDTIRTSTESVE